MCDAQTLAGVPEDAGVTHPGDAGARSGHRRIDHVLVSGGVVARLRHAWIDADADGSEHQPVWAGKDWSGRGGRAKRGGPG